MMNVTTFVGLDVHARSIKAVSLDAMTGEVRCAAFGYDAAAVADWVKAIDPKARCVYESGVTGFDLQKKLAALGVDCVVGAVWIGYTKLDSFVRAGRVRRSPWRTRSTPGISPTSSSGR